MREVAYYRHTAPLTVEKIEHQPAPVYRPINQYAVIGMMRRYDTHDFSRARAVARDLSIRFPIMAVSVTVIRDIGTPIQSGPEYILKFHNGVGSRWSA